ESGIRLRLVQGGACFSLPIRAKLGHPARRAKDSSPVRQHWEQNGPAPAPGRGGRTNARPPKTPNLHSYTPCARGNSDNTPALRTPRGSYKTAIPRSTVT